MPKLNIGEMRERESTELRDELEKLRKESFDLKLKSATEAVASPARFRQIRRDVARLATLIRERELNIRGAKKS